jgi:signal peptidase I
MAGRAAFPESDAFCYPRQSSRQTARAEAAEMKSRDARSTGKINKRGDRAAGTSPDPLQKHQRRESIESFVIVVVAFLVWCIEAEGFVIPTGSMAPTLMGRHKEVVCPDCEHTYWVNADCEVDSSGSGKSTGLRVAWGTCENCRLETRVDHLPSVSGDRIYTMKRGLEIPFLPAAGRVGPNRWEVAVFKLPEEPEVRYIKRLVGMPGEIIRIRQGDIWCQPADGSEPFRRLRRPPAHQQAMQVLVYDDAHRPASLRDDPAWRRWVSQGAGWTEPTAGTYKTTDQEDGWSELCYRHVVPDPEQWESIRAGLVPVAAPRRTLITDFSSYNTDLTEQGRRHPRFAARPWFQPQWVGDLTLSLRVDVRRPSGRLRLELIKAGHQSRCEIDLATGQATLSRDGQALGDPAPTRLRIPGSHTLALANVDERLTLWVDGSLPFGDGRLHRDSEEETTARPTIADLEPARIAVRGAALEVSGLILKRDLHYTLDPSEPDHRELDDLPYQGPRVLFDLLADPNRYAALADPPPRDFPIGPGAYLMLGDNSPWSRDGRAWGRADQIDPHNPGKGWDESGRESWEVPETLVVGKAFCVYWPHLKPVWPEFRMGTDYRLPARPYLERMRWIR